MAKRGVQLTYETVREWCRKFGPLYAAKLRKKRAKIGSKWHLDEVFIKINGVQHYLWRAVDQNGATIDILVQPRRDRWAALRFFRKLLDTTGRASMIRQPTQIAAASCNELQTDEVYQRLYQPVSSASCLDASPDKSIILLFLLVARAGVQPATFALGVRCSMQLSYRATGTKHGGPRSHAAPLVPL